MFNLKGPQGQNPRTTRGPRTTVWETLAYTTDHEWRYYSSWRQKYSVLAFQYMNALQKVVSNKGCKF